MDDKQRTEIFLRMTDTLKSEGYTETVCVISVLKANLLALVTAGPIALLCGYHFIYNVSFTGFKFRLTSLLLFYLALIATFFVHEALHGLTWSMFCKNGLKSIHLGVMWRKLTPYCCCMEPLSFWSYLAGGLMPFAVLGLGMYAAAFFTKSVFLMLLSLVNIIAAGGDTTIALMLLRHRNALIIDHPTECGFCAFTK